MNRQFFPSLVLTLLLASPLRGQATAAADSLSLTLADALARVSQREPRLATARAMREVARAARGEALSEQRNRFLPVVSASFGTQRLVQNQFVEIARRAGLPPTPVDQLDPFAQVFAAPNTRTAAITAAVRPYDGGVSSARVAAAQAGAQASAYAESQVRTALEADVITRYADVQLSRRLREVADSALALAERTLAVTRQAVAQGRTAEYEIWRVDADVQALRPAQLDADRQLQVAELALRQLLELPAHLPLRLASPAEPWTVDRDAATTDSTSPRSVPGAPNARLALREFDAREQQAAAQHRAAWRALLPTLDVTLSHQRLAYPLRNNDWGGPFYQNTVLGVSFTFPLDLTGGSVARIEAAAANRRLAQAQRRDAERVHALEQTELQAQLAASRVAWQAAVAGGVSAEKALRVAQLRHEVGRASLLELQDARVAWQRAMATRAQAARDRTVIEARVARLDRLPLAPIQP
jgi:outer membrane protein TolC